MHGKEIEISGRGVSTAGFSTLARINVTAHPTRGRTVALEVQRYALTL